MKDERRKAGRPRSQEPKSTVSTWISAREHDRLIRLANEREQTVSKTVLQIIRERLSSTS